MRKKIFTFLLALVASVGMMNAKVTWDSSNMSSFAVSETDQPYTLEGVTLRTNASLVMAYCDGYGDEIHFVSYETGGFTFSNTLGKNFTKIEMFLTSSGGWGNANLGSGWSFMNNGPVTWTGNASTVDLLKDEDDFGGASVKIVFYFEGDSQEPDPTYTVALEDGTVNADKVTLSATSAIEGATITVTPDEEYEITAFSAYYVVVEDQLGSIYEIDATLDPGTGAYSFTMPAANVTIEATIAEKAAPQPAGPTIPCTAADLGKVLCTDGSIYATVSEASAASKTAAAVITYVDTENNKGLALALANESGTMDWETAKTTAVAHTPAVSGGTWTLASKDDWDHMINAAGGYNALRDGFSGVGGTNIQKGQYWTSTEYDSGVSLVLNFGTNDGGYFVGLNEDAFSVRACLAFDISAAPAPAEDVDITPNVDPENPTFYYSTFFDSSVKYELPENVEAYIVTTVSGDAMQLQKVAEAGQTIPAGAGVILKSRVNGFTLEVSDADAVSVEGNRLEGSDVSIATPANCYVLSCENGLVGFYRYNASMLNPHKAYIIYDAPNSGNQAPRRLRFAFETATGVENVQNSDIRSQKVVENGQLIIIRNGVRYNAAGQNVK